MRWIGYACTFNPRISIRQTSSGCFFWKIRKCFNIEKKIIKKNKFLIKISKKVLVHEWAHFRYGVFDEYPHKTLENNAEFYINSRGEVEATRCSINLSGHVKNLTDKSRKCNGLQSNGLPGIDCIFEADVKEFDPKVQLGSLMYKPYLEQVF